MLRAAALALASTLLLAALAPASAAQDQWRKTQHSMSDALDANFNVVDTYFDNKGNLVFVLQRGPTVLLCGFEKLVFIECLELNADE